MYHGILIFIVCLCLFVLFLLFPRTGKRQELLKLYRGTCFAHRGYHSIENGIPENSMPRSVRRFPTVMALSWMFISPKMADWLFSTMIL